MTSAPKSAMTEATNGPATTCPTSSTRMPSKTPLGRLDGAGKSAACGVSVMAAGELGHMHDLGAGQALDLGRRIAQLPQYLRRMLAEHRRRPPDAARRVGHEDRRCELRDRADPGVLRALHDPQG